MVRHASFRVGPYGRPLETTHGWGWSCLFARCDHSSASTHSSYILQAVIWFRIWRTDVYEYDHIYIFAKGTVHQCTYIPYICMYVCMHVLYDRIRTSRLLSGNRRTMHVCTELLLNFFSPFSSINHWTFELVCDLEVMHVCNLPWMGNTLIGGAQKIVSRIHMQLLWTWMI